MSRRSLADSPPPSTRRSIRHHRCDYPFLQLLEEDSGIPRYALENSLMGMSPAAKKKAIALCEWAIRVTAGDVEQAGTALLAWARKHHRRSFGLDA